MANKCKYFSSYPIFPTYGIALLDLTVLRLRPLIIPKTATWR